MKEIITFSDEIVGSEKAERNYNWKIALGVGRNLLSIAPGSFSCPLERKHSIASVKPIPIFIIRSYTTCGRCPKSFVVSHELRWALKLGMARVNLAAWLAILGHNAPGGIRKPVALDWWPHLKTGSQEETRSLVTLIHSDIKPSLKLDFLMDFPIHQLIYGTCWFHSLGTLTDGTSAKHSIK